MPEQMSAQEALRRADDAIHHLEAEGISSQRDYECGEVILIFKVLRNALARSIERGIIESNGKQRGKRGEPRLKGSSRGANTTW